MNRGTRMSIGLEGHVEKGAKPAHNAHAPRTARKNVRETLPQAPTAEAPVLSGGAFQPPAELLAAVAGPSPDPLRANMAMITDAAPTINAAPRHVLRNPLRPSTAPLPSPVNEGDASPLEPELAAARRCFAAAISAASSADAMRCSVAA
mmetsp:Transcript_26350/g.81425  ORF Transcript_26350/g.81425 Transcript_26350/m.81425 type:complete len:149 (-) Transcript_26350:774-1220(-)